jgi:putative FmdB family regulatory protein
MPIYEYRCQCCGHEFEKIQRLSDRPIRKCPECGGGTEKLLSAASFALRGGGWYSDGYSSSSAKASSASEKPAEGGKKPAKTSEGSGGSDSSGKAGKD